MREMAAGARCESPHARRVRTQQRRLQQAHDSSPRGLGRLEALAAARNCEQRGPFTGRESSLGRAVVFCNVWRLDGPYNTRHPSADHSRCPGSSLWLTICGGQITHVSSARRWTHSMKHSDLEVQTDRGEEARLACGGRRRAPKQQFGQQSSIASVQLLARWTRRRRGRNPTISRRAIPQAWELLLSLRGHRNLQLAAPGPSSEQGNPLLSPARELVLLKSNQYLHIPSAV
jgi:hypothetical protein